MSGGLFLFFALCFFFILYCRSNAISKPGIIFFILFTWNYLCVFYQLHHNIAKAQPLAPVSCVVNTIEERCMRTDCQNLSTRRVQHEKTCTLVYAHYLLWTHFKKCVLKRLFLSFEVLCIIHLSWSTSWIDCSQD